MARKANDRAVMKRMRQLIKPNASALKAMRRYGIQTGDSVQGFRRFVLKVRARDAT